MEEYIKEAPQTGSVCRRLEYQEADGTSQKAEEEPSQPPETENKPEETQEEKDLLNLEDQEEEEQPKEEPEAPPLVSTDDTGDLLGLSEIHAKAAELEESNALALAIVPPGSGPGPSSSGNSWSLIEASSGSGWELALVTTPSNQTNAPKVETKLAGGFDKLLLDSLYEDDAARRQIQLQNAGYRQGMMGAENPFEQSNSAATDPFIMSNNIAAPLSVQMAMMAQQQQQLIMQQQQHQLACQYPGQQHHLPGMMMVPYSQQQTHGTVAANPFGDPFPMPQQTAQPHDNNYGLI